MDLKDRINDELKKIIDPDTKIDVASMGLIRNISVADDGDTSLDFVPSSSVCPVVFTVALNLRDALKKIDGIKNLNITVKEHNKADEINKLLKEDN